MDEQLKRCHSMYLPSVLKCTQVTVPPAFSTALTALMDAYETSRCILVFIILLFC